MVRKITFLDTRGLFDHIDLFARGDVIGLVGDDVHERAAGAVLGLVHEQLQFLRARGKSTALRKKPLATQELELAGIGEDRKRITGRKGVARDNNRAKAGDCHPTPKARLARAAAEALPGSKHGFACGVIT